MTQKVPGVRIKRRALPLLSCASVLFLGCSHARAAVMEDETYANFLRSAAETLGALLPATTPSQQDGSLPARWGLKD